MKDKWQKLNLKEQRLLIFLAVFVTVSVFYFLIWQPLNDNIAKAEKKVVKQEALLVWVNDKISIISQSGSASGASNRNESLSSIINKTATQNNIEITRMQPRGDDIQIWIDKAVFTRLLPWIEHLALVENLHVEAIDLSVTEQAGVVNVRRLQIGRR